MYCRYCVSVGITLLAAIGTVLPSYSQTLSRLQSTNFVRSAGLRIEPGLSYTWGTSAREFFEDYAGVLGGIRREFDTPISGTLRISRHLDEHQSAGIVVGFLRSTLRENYNYIPARMNPALAPAQNITQNINLETIPLMLCYDIYPVDRQFTSYVGAAAGIGFSHLRWFEDITSSSNRGARSKGLRFDSWLYHVVLEARTGVSLGFDGSVESAFRSGLRFECSYRYIPVRGQFMENVAKSFTAQPPSRLRDSYTIDVGGISVHVGIMIVLRHTERPRRTP
jgi:hypothetical protein